MSCICFFVLITGILNISSLNQHFTELCNLLDSTLFSFDFIGCSETWLSPQTNLDCLNIPGYVLVNNNREFSSGGGVGLFIKLEHNFKLRIKGRLELDIIKNVWIETQYLIVGVIYKPPSLSNREFLDKFEETLQTIYLSNKKCLIMGDDNFNTLKPTYVSKEYVVESDLY